MGFGKKYISNNIAAKAHISRSESSKLLDNFLSIIKNTCHDKNIKISNFGTFYRKKTPSRMGRNPKTREEFFISQRVKLFFKPSSKIKSLFN